jgi:hypothetical protein
MTTLSLAPSTRRVPTRLHALDNFEEYRLGGAVIP